MQVGRWLLKVGYCAHGSGYSGTCPGVLAGGALLALPLHHLYRRAARHREQAVQLGGDGRVGGRGAGCQTAGTGPMVAGGEDVVVFLPLGGRSLGLLRF